MKTGGKLDQLLCELTVHDIVLSIGHGRRKKCQRKDNGKSTTVCLFDPRGKRISSGFRAVPPGAWPAIYPGNRSSMLGVAVRDSMNGGVITMSRPQFLMMQEPSLLDPIGNP